MEDPECFEAALTLYLYYFVLLIDHSRCRRRDLDTIEVEMMLNHEPNSR